MKSLLLSLSVFLSLGVLAPAQTVYYDWDANADALDGITNGSGGWNLSGDLNWLDADGISRAWADNYNTIARFGNAPRAAANVITLGGTLRLGGIDFVSAVTTAPMSGNQYTFAGTGVLDFAPNSVITIADGASGSSPFITFASTITLRGNNLTVRKSGGTAMQFIQFSGTAFPDVTGIFTVGGNNGGVFLRGNPNTFGAVDRIVVEANSTFSAMGTGTYATPFSLAGYGGSSQYGAIRVDVNNITFSGGITLTGDAGIQTNTNGITGTRITGAISEATPGLSFTRYATGAGTGTLTLTAANTYSGDTILGRTGNFSGAITILDFNSATPSSDILYNGVATPGNLSLIGGNNSSTVLNLNGKDATNNSQRLGNVLVSGTRSVIQLTSGANGSMDLYLGDFIRSGTGLLTLQAPQKGDIHSTRTDGPLGAWALFTDAKGFTAWAGVQDQKISHFMGDTPYVTDVTVSGLPVTASSHLEISSASTGDVLLAPGTTNVKTISMTDTADRQVPIETGNTLRLGDVGGIQIVTGAGSLTVGTQGEDGVLSAGGSVGGVAGQLVLSNANPGSLLTVHSIINNNGAGAVSLLVQGVPGATTVLTNDKNSYTGGTWVGSGRLEIQAAKALGTSGTVTVLENATLQLSSGIQMTRNFSIAGPGDGGVGALRSQSGDNAITGVITQLAPSRITAAAGSSLTVKNAAATADGIVINGNYALTFDGEGDIFINGRISTGSLTLTKMGAGSLTLQGSNVGTGPFVLNGGTVNLDFSPTSAPSTNILYNGVNASTFTQGAGGGMLRMIGKANADVSQTFSATTLNGVTRIEFEPNDANSIRLNLGAITRNLSTLLMLNSSAAGGVTTTSGTNNAILVSATGTPYGLVGSYDWAATTSAVSSIRNIVGLSSINGYTLSTATTLSGNADIAAGVTTLTLSANATTTSLRFNQPQATTVTNDGTARILTTNGILVTPAVGANPIILSPGSIRPAGTGTTTTAELVIAQNNTAAPLIITSRIHNALRSDGGVATTSLIKTGPGTLILEYNSAYVDGSPDYTGTTRIQEGALQLARTTNFSGGYTVNFRTVFTLGSGSVSGKLILGRDGISTYQYGGLATVGTGTNNAVVGGSSAYSTYHNYVAVSDFRNGFIGGPGLYEDNVNVNVELGVLTLGPANTYKGKTTVNRNTLEVTKLANIGQPSSIGTGDANAAAAILSMAGQTTGTNANLTVIATLRYIGDTDSVTNRPIDFSNGDVATDVSSTTLVLENTGTGTVKFTSPFTAGGSNTVERLLRLSGTNKGDNEIVSITDAGTAAKTRIEKVDIGKWTITGNSMHSGGTVVSNGILQLGNGGTAGSVNEGYIYIEEQGTLRVSRSDNHALRSIIFGNGTFEIANTPTGVTRLTNPFSDFFGTLKVLSGALLVDSTEPGFEFLSPTGYGSITVSPGATLGGSGYILPDVGQSITLTGGYLDIGTSRDVAGHLTIGAGDGADLALQAGSTILFDLISGAGLGDQTDNMAAADLLTVYGSLVLGDDSILQVRTELLPNAFAEGDAWKLFDWEGLAERQGSFASTVLPDLSPELKWDLSELYTLGVIQVVAIPEPGRMLLLGIALACISLRRRRAME